MKRLLHFFYENYKPILTSLFLALLLWVAVTTDREYTYQLEVPFRIDRLAEGYVLANVPPQNVLLEISGKGRALIALYFYKKKIDLELPEVDSSREIDLKNYKSRFNFARELGVNIVDIVEPKSIKLEVDRHVEQKKPIRIRSKIKTIPGYIFSGAKLSRDSVLVSGPASIVSPLKYIYSDSITREDVKYPFDFNVSLNSPVKEIVNLDPASVDVNFAIEQLVERNIHNVPIQLVGLPENLTATATPPVVTIRIKGSENIISSLSGNEITVFFDYSKSYKPGKTIYSMQIDTPPNITIVKIIPESFKLSLKRSEITD